MITSFASFSISAVCIVVMPSPSTAEGFTLALPIIVAIVVYMLLHLAVNGLLRMLAHRKTQI
jgi:hypothetical protein